MSSPNWAGVNAAICVDVNDENVAAEIDPIAVELIAANVAGLSANSASGINAEMLAPFKPLI